MQRIFGGSRRPMGHQSQSNYDWFIGGLKDFTVISL
jgi:hypothetical protein